jgi:hypothetical protein
MPHHTTTRFMRHPAASVALVLALAAMAPSTLADIVDIAWDADGRFERSVSVAPGKFAEVCGKLPAGLKIGWNFEASAPLATKIDQDYCWMWSNKSAASATIMVKLQR